MAETDLQNTPPSKHLGWSAGVHSGKTSQSFWDKVTDACDFSGILLCGIQYILTSLLGCSDHYQNKTKQKPTNKQKRAFLLLWNLYSFFRCRWESQTKNGDTFRHYHPVLLLLPSEYSCSVCCSSTWLLICFLELLSFLLLIFTKRGVLLYHRCCKVWILITVCMGWNSKAQMVNKWNSFLPILLLEFLTCQHLP